MLSELDKSLVSCSPLRIVAREVLGITNEPIWDYNTEWDVALEACVLPGYMSPRIWPQLMLWGDNVTFHADLKELHQVGSDKYYRKFLANAKRARNSLRNDHRRPKWIWERVRKRPRRGRYPPRIFTPHRYKDIHDSISFICRYHGEENQEQILWLFDHRVSLKGRFQLCECVGVRDPETQFPLAIRKILRAFVKIGINLLAFVCDHTEVNKDTFKDAVDFVLHDRGQGPSPEDSGFVVNADIQALGRPQKAHRFRLTYDGNWILDCAFFEGRIGATVAFPGPNHESWRRVDIEAPLHSHDWSIEKSAILLPRNLHVEWYDLARIIPSVQIKTVDASLRVERARKWH